VTDDEIASLMNDTAGQHWGTEMHFRRFAYALLAAEREACAKVCDALHVVTTTTERMGTSVECADAIRARNKT
jgi:hypothetical protein